MAISLGVDSRNANSQSSCPDPEGIRFHLMKIKFQGFDGFVVEFGGVEVFGES